MEIFLSSHFVFQIQKNNEDDFKFLEDGWVSKIANIEDGNLQWGYVLGKKQE